MIDQVSGEARLIYKKDHELLQLKSMIIFQSKIRNNCMLVEDAMQTLIHAYGIPLRLHRHVAKGNSQEDPDRHEISYLCKVFLTTIPKICVDDYCQVNF